MGPVSNKTQFEKIQRLLQKGVEEGATVVVGGPGRPDGLDSGYFVRPTVFANVNNDMTIAREEIFGPVLVMIPYKSEEEAVRIANDTVYGLSGYVYSGDIENARRVARRLRTGMVHLNGASTDVTRLSAVTSNRATAANGASGPRRIPRDQGDVRLPTRRTRRLIAADKNRPSCLARQDAACRTACAYRQATTTVLNSITARSEEARPFSKSIRKKRGSRPCRKPTSSFPGAAYSPGLLEGIRGGARHRWRSRACRRTGG